ncbi:hypothetical protein M8C21_027793 [Ambrosia artemisiifolia]|uniref:Uncharacterized protein n=1 Tax=Ambrosia artemisiifolia TaxID=4212 RepID=A0AAD5GSU5_AMBAR|nr:hypothetical protein M8C21_027793 [Ambrosia artemisiifolia]
MTNEYGGTILKQLQRLGTSLDCSRECFTMDEKGQMLLYKEGIISGFNEVFMISQVGMCIVNYNIQVDYHDIEDKTQTWWSV